MQETIRRLTGTAVALLTAIALLIAGCGQAGAQGASRGPAGPGDSACIRMPPAATSVRSMRDLARLVMSSYGQFQGRNYPILITRVTNAPPDWIVALAGVDENGGSGAGQREINSWITAFGTLSPYQLAQYDPYARAVVAAMARFNMSRSTHVLLAGHSLGGIVAQNLGFYAVPAASFFSGWSQVSDWPLTRLIVLGAPRVNFPQLLGPSGTIEEISHSPVRFFAAWHDPAVIGPGALPYRFRPPPLLSEPPWFTWIDGGSGAPHDPSPSAHFAYDVSQDMLAYNPFGDATATKGQVTLELDPQAQYRCTGMPASVAAYSFGAPGPSQHAPACALVSLATLRAEVAQVRQVLPSNAKRSGNVAVAHIVARQVPCFLSASSRVDTPTRDEQLAVGLVGAATGRFATGPTPRNDDSGEMRENTDVDTENKILDEIGRSLDWDPGRAGVIQLFTERAPCASCSDVIAQFTRAFPRMTLMVLDNNGAGIPPAGP